VRESACDARACAARAPPWAAPDASGNRRGARPGPAARAGPAAAGPQGSPASRRAATPARFGRRMCDGGLAHRARRLGRACRPLRARPLDRHEAGAGVEVLVLQSAQLPGAHAALRPHPQHEPPGRRQCLGRAAWSLMLALRSRGLGTAWTTLHLYHEKEVAALLGIPNDVTQVVHLSVAYYTGADFKPGANTSNRCHNASRTPLLAVREIKHEPENHAASEGFPWSGGRTHPPPPTDSWDRKRVRVPCRGPEAAAACIQCPYVPARLQTWA
jgi:nitroreductase family protein